MGRYRKRPVVIEAMHWTNDTPFHDAVDFLGSDFRGSKGGPDGLCLLIATPENPRNPFVAPPGWWLIRGVIGEAYACAPDVFAATYEPVET